jgi:hypothetical protein
VSELLPDGHLKSAGSPEAMRIGAARATSLFRDTRWDEFMVTAERLPDGLTWTIRVEPKTGERDDSIWVDVKDNHVTHFGFRRKDKLKGYTWKSMKGATPGYCR